MSPLLELGVACGLFLLVPGATIALGSLWILQRFGMNNRLSAPLGAVLFGLAGAEATFIGMALDPRRVDHAWSEVFITSGMTGLGSTLVVLIGTWAYVGFLRLLRR